MPAAMLSRLAAAYGSRAVRVTGNAGSLAGLGRHFGADLYEAEVRYLIAHEFARTGEDVLWRRSKLGLVLTPGEQADFGEYVAAQAGS
jgi:glycerol-3-phosphate dehydrogenase